MAEYIERGALIAEYDRAHKGPAGGARKLMVDAPTADVVEVRHGKWEKDPIAIRGVGEIYDYRCSVCTARAHKGEYGNYDYITSYCPNCGAKMDGKGEGE